MPASRVPRCASWAHQVSSAGRSISETRTGGDEDADDRGIAPILESVALAGVQHGAILRLGQTGGSSSSCFGLRIFAIGESFDSPSSGPQLKVAEGVGRGRRLEQRMSSDLMNASTCSAPDGRQRRRHALSMR